MSNNVPAGISYSTVWTVGQWQAAWQTKQDWSSILDQIIQQGGAPSFLPPTAWTPVDASFGGLAFTGVSAEYSVVGNLVLVSATLTYPSTASTAAAGIKGLPYTVPNSGYATTPSLLYVVGAAAAMAVTELNNPRVNFFSLSTGSAVENVTLSGATVSFALAYPLT